LAPAALVFLAIFQENMKLAIISTSSAATQDQMRPFSHALPHKGTDVAASERSRKWLFAFQYRLLMAKQ
jgi:hypothetical protein